MSDDEVKTLRELLYDHFDSHVIASQDSIENYMAATEWMSIKHRLDVEYGNSIDKLERKKISSEELAANAQRYESSDRFKAIVNEHATRNANRALRRINQLEELANVVSDEPFHQSLDIAVKDIATAITHMSENNALHYKRNLNLLSKSDGSFSDSSNGKVWADHLNKSINKHNLQIT